MSKCRQCGLKLDSGGLCHGCLFQMATEFASPSGMINHEGDAPSVEELSVSFPQLEILRLIGRGGMGLIYHARQTALDRDVALKIIDRRFPRDSEFFDRFEREAKVLAKISHPNVVTIYDYGHTDSGLAYFEMEYVHGLNLREAMDSMSVDADEAIGIVKQVCNALQYAHSKGIVHRDIKPENILLGDDGSLKIADFGIARIVESEGLNRLTATRQVLGTPHYLAPEQIESPDEADHRVDIYALGVVLYELLTKKLPVGIFEAPSTLAKGINPKLDSIVMKSLNRRPTARFQSADEFRQAIESVSAISGSLSPESATIDPLLEHVAVSVPFETEDAGGCAEVLGSLQAFDTGIRIEYRIRDAFFGTFKSKVRTLEIPWGRVARVEFRCGPFKGKLTIVGNSISALKDFPRSETGRIEVKVIKSNYELADKVLELARSVSPSLVPRESLYAGQRNPCDLTLALTLIFFAILNAGTLAILQVIFASELHGMMHAIAAIAVPVALGPVIIMQFLSGIIHASTGSRDAVKVGAIASLFPVTPVAIAGIFFGIRAQKWLDNGTGTPLAAQLIERPKSWGASTIVYMRDARNARWIAALETLGAMVIFAGIAIYFLGFYPSSMQYRVVGPASREALEPMIQKRLKGISGTVVSGWDESQFRINCWQYQKASIESRLSLSSTPNVRFPVPSIPSVQGKTESYLPTTLNRSMKSVATRKSAAGLEIMTRNEVFELKDEQVGRIQVSNGNRIVVELSKSGWRSLQSMLKEHETNCGLCLEVEGWIVGIANPTDFKDQQIIFEFSENSKHSSASIQSAVRGPSLPNELEWLE